MIQFGKVLFEFEQIADDRGVKLAIYLCHIWQNVPDDFRRVMDVIERSDPSKRERQVTRRCGESVFVLRLRRLLSWKKWRL